MMDDRGKNKLRGWRYVGLINPHNAEHAINRANDLQLQIAIRNYAYNDEKRLLPTPVAVYAHKNYPLQTVFKFVESLKSLWLDKWGD